MSSENHSTSASSALLVGVDWNAKVGSQEKPGVTGKFGLGVQNEAGQRLIRVLPREHSRDDMGCTEHSSTCSSEIDDHLYLRRLSQGVSRGPKGSQATFSV